MGSGTAGRRVPWQVGLDPVSESVQQQFMTCSAVLGADSTFSSSIKLFIRASCMNDSVC
jgi:hypothetical protein